MSTTRALVALLAQSLDADDHLVAALHTLAGDIRAMSVELQNLTAAVAAQASAITALQTAVDSKQEAIATAIAGLEQKIADLGGIDPALQAILDGLTANNAALAAATQDVIDTPVPVNPAPPAP